MITKEHENWSVEDLLDHYKRLLKERDSVELNTERAQLNREAMIVMAEIQQREKDE